MNILEQILENYNDEEFLIAVGFDEAVIGVDIQSGRLVYSVTKCLDILMEDMSFEDAMEHFDYNIRGAYLGEKTPIWCHDAY